MTVREYFRSKLAADRPELLLEPTLADERLEMNIETPCGVDCRELIDAAAEFASKLDPHPAVRRPFLCSLITNLLIFICG